jgi:hypothetical protein
MHDMLKKVLCRVFDGNMEALMTPVWHGMELAFVFGTRVSVTHR